MKFFKFSTKDIPKCFLAIVGPTASGKTEVACEIARRIPVEMISCDSMQVYKEMPILTQTPSAQEKRLLKAHLVSVLPVTKEYNAACFRKDALAIMEKILKRRRLPIIVGGTGLYLRALLDGLFESEGDLAGKDEALRRALEDEEKINGPGSLHKKLKTADPEAASKIHPNDLRRIIRALEVFMLTGKPLSEQKNRRTGIRDRYLHKIFLLNRLREDLYDRINKRVDFMIKQGLLNEIKRLQKRKMSLTAGMALGIREMGDYLKGSMPRDKAVDLFKQHTRNYAKRQLSWFRHEKDIETIDVPKEEPASKIAEKIIQGWEEVF